MLKVLAKEGKVLSEYMRIVKHTVETKATPIQIWKIWEDVENWKTWDEQIELSQLDGPFQTGTTGCTKFIGTLFSKLC